MENIKEYTKEELMELNEKFHCLTVGDLKEFLAEHDLPDNAPVVIQRVHDVYYEKHGWKLYLKEGDHTLYTLKHNKNVERGEYLDKKKYPNAKGKTIKPFTEEQIKESMEQYRPAWSCVRYGDDKDILFIDLHY